MKASQIWANVNFTVFGVHTVCIWNSNIVWKRKGFALLYK